MKKKTKEIQKQFILVFLRKYLMSKLITNKFRKRNKRDRIILDPKHRFQIIRIF